MFIRNLDKALENPYNDDNYYYTSDVDLMKELSAQGFPPLGLVSETIYVFLSTKELCEYLSGGDKL